MSEMFSTFYHKEDPKSLSTLFGWFKKIVNSYKDWQLDSKVYEGMVARFIGPLSRVKVKVLSEVINYTHENLEEHGFHEQIKSKWVQLNKTQSEIALTNPGFCGSPGILTVVKQFLPCGKYRKCYEV